MSAVLSPAPRRRAARPGGARAVDAQDALFAAEATPVPAAAHDALLAPEPVAESTDAQDVLFAPESAAVCLDAPPTLDDVISHGWESVRAGVAMACPVCDGELAPDAGRGCCDRCGSTLA